MALVPVTEIFEFACSIPTTATQAAPAVISNAMPSRNVEWVEFVIPPGARGVVGFQLRSKGSQVFPRPIGTFLITDDEKPHWDVTGQHDSGAWELAGYNTGNYAHTIYVRYGVNPIAAPLPANGGVIPSAALSVGGG